MNEVYSDVNENGVATLTLNNPKALNSINLNMVQIIKKTLNQWESDDRVHLIIMEGEGDRAFCAGGDIKSIYKANIDNQIKDKAIQFFNEEYQLDAYIYEYPKPIIANLGGVVMGGGVGLSYHADYRIVSEKTIWAMPEMNLGFFPDVGSGYFLNKAPGYLGRYIALTGENINGKDAIYINAADYIIPFNEIKRTLEFIKNINWDNKNIKDTLQQIFKKNTDNSIIKGELELSEKKINQHFKFNTIEKIVHSLKHDQSDFAKQTKKTILSKSPVSIKIALEQSIRCKNKTLKEALNLDKIIASNFLEHDDFYEGVRSVLIDKDRMPNYDYNELSKVNDKFIKSFFVN